MNPHPQNHARGPDSGRDSTTAFELELLAAFPPRMAHGSLQSLGQAARRMGRSYSGAFKIAALSLKAKGLLHYHGDDGTGGSYRLTVWCRTAKGEQYLVRRFGAEGGRR